MLNHFVCEAVDGVIEVIKLLPGRLINCLTTSGTPLTQSTTCPGTFLSSG